MRCKSRIVPGCSDESFCGSTPSARRSFGSSLAACGPLAVTDNSSPGLRPHIAGDKRDLFGRTVRQFISQADGLSVFFDPIGDRIENAVMFIATVDHHVLHESAALRGHYT